MQLKHSRWINKGLLLLATLTLVNCATAKSLADSEKKVYQFTLDNGLKILLQEDHRAPVVVSQIWYKVGSSYEYKGITGVSHVLEHMMFKGTKKYAPGEFSEIIAYNGGRENAFTSKDYTAYFQRIASDRLKICFELEADRMVNLRLDKKDFEKELAVVKEERRMRTDDKPRSALYEQFNAVAYITSPYRNPTIGWMQDLDKLTIDDVRQWYKTWYSPNNATLVVVGDIDPYQVLDLAKKYFGPIPAAKLPAQKAHQELPQKGSRSLLMKLPAKLPYLLMGYKVPVLSTAKNKKEAYALEVLAAVLDGGNSARFAKNLIRGSEVAASAGASYGLSDRLDSLFIFDGIPSNGKTIEQLKQAIQQQMQDMIDGKISQQELDRIKAGVLASKIYERDSMFYQAMQMGIAETVGIGYQELDEFAKQIQQITLADVQQVAKKYFNEDHLTTAVLEPLPLHKK